MTSRLLSASLDSTFEHYSGIGMSPTETALELQDYRQTRSVESVVKGLTAREEFLHDRNLPRNSFQEDPIYFSTRLQMLVQALEANPRDAALTEALRLLMSRVAYFAYASTRTIGIEQWIKDMFSPSSFSTQSETMRFIRAVFGEDSISYRMMSVK